jgi:hypothetical protein
MNATPTPEEARDALQDVERRRAQTAAASGRSRWVWIGAGVLIVAWGVLIDQKPGFAGDWGSIVVGLLLLVVVLGNTRRGGSLLRRQVRPRLPHDSSAMLWSGLVIVLLIGGAALAVALHTPHVALWTSLAGGLLLAAAGPWWQRRVLTREARR